jgi:mannose-6-phosphate isomerase-like protein (cupin superfamily)
MPVTNWTEQVYNVIGSVLYDNPRRTVHFMVRDAAGALRDRTELPAPVRRLAETPVPAPRNELRTLQFVHHVLIPPAGRHVQELHIHPDAEELVIITQGAGTMIIDGEATAVRPGDVAYIPPYAEHELRNDSTDLLGAFFINVPVGEALRPLLSDAEPAARDAGLGS